MKKLFKERYLILFLSILILVIAPKEKILGIFSKTSTAQAVGDLIIDWGVPAGKPIFYVLNFMPGDEETRTVKITNASTNVRIIGIQGIKTNFPGFLASALEITISENGTDIYGGSKGKKTLSQFFMESVFLNSLKLLSLNPGQTKTITFKVEFKESAGNFYQKTKVVFDLKIGYYLTEVKGCEGIRFCSPCTFSFSNKCFFTK